jgi:adhesin transport system membrane fusion protein
MLNISENQVHKKVNLNDFKSGKFLAQHTYGTMLKKILALFSILLLIISFLPWTQNIRGKGTVTALMPNERPQTIQSPIPGRIEEWFVKEGDFVNKGDTIVRISEITSTFFDSQLMVRTAGQITAKNRSVEAYDEKVKALQKQINALEREQALNFEQANNRLLQAELSVKSDSINFVAAQTNNQIAEIQYNRIQKLQEEGLKSLREVEEKRLQYQETQAKLISQENKLLSSKNQLLNAKMDIEKITATYADRISKIESDIFNTQSAQQTTIAEVFKLENENENFRVRSGLMFITAPQDGFITKALRTGIGETFKEGEQLVSVMPASYTLAIETYIRPIDLPLVHIGEKARVQFDGWPAIVFSGWPNLSYGTYSAEVVAIDNFTSENGKYRLLLAPDKSEEPWPDALRVGAGAMTIQLLNDVPIWYEVWRQLNSFPPDYYTPNMKTEN